MSGNMEWVEDDCCIIPNYALKTFDNMRNCLEWINEHHPEVLKEYNKFKEKVSE